MELEAGGVGDAWWPQNQQAYFEVRWMTPTVFEALALVKPVAVSGPEAELELGANVLIQVSQTRLTV